MGASTFGRHFQIHSFGESHGPALGCVIEGCPAQLAFDLDFLQLQLQRRRPGRHGLSQNEIISQRDEADRPEILSGVFEGRTLGTPIAILVRNQDARSTDYAKIRSQPRAGHADDVWQLKFGHRDHRGGGRSSGRETVARVMGGAVAMMLLRHLHPEIRFFGIATQIGPLVLSTSEKQTFFETTHEELHPQDAYPARFPSSQQREEVRALLAQAQETGESYGARGEIRVQGLPSGLGQPVFQKLKSELAAAFMSVGAVSSFQIGDSPAAQAKGTEFHSHAASHYGGIRGGLSTGEDLILQFAVKPTSSILDVAKKGRHDPCIITRALPVLEAMTALVLADQALLRRLDVV